MGGSKSKAKPAQVPNQKESTTPIIETAEATCEDYNFNTTGCNITIQGKLLLVLDSINSTIRNYFSCFCEVVYARLNNTNVTTEILAGRNQTSCSNPDFHSNVDEVLLQEKLMNLIDYEELDKYAGMAVILTDRGFTSENISALSDGKEPFVYFVNVGENESQNGSCYRQYRYVDDMTEINEIGLELESIACNPSSVYMNNSCMQEKPSSSTPSLAVVQVASLPLIISITVVIALIMVVFIILFFIKKRKIQETCNKNTPLDDSAKDSRFEALDGPGKGAMPTNDIYNELRENEKRTYDDENQQNYHHLDLNFVKGDSDPSMHDHVTEKADHNEVFISSG